MMEKSARRFIYLLLAVILNSCYSLKPEYSLKVSSGGVMVGSSCYFLAQVREYRQPKGIARFPDGGRTKELRQLFGLFRSDTLSGIMSLAAGIGKVYGWPVRYSTRLDKGKGVLTFGIININLPDSVNGIYLFYPDSGKLQKFSGDKALPAISKTGPYIAYSLDRKVYTENYITRSATASYQIDADPVYLSWESENELLIFCSNPYSVIELNLSSGVIYQSDLKYISNYNQELSAGQINRIVNKANPDLKALLDMND